MHELRIGWVTQREFDKRRGCKADVLVLQLFFLLKKATSGSEVPLAMFLSVGLASLFSHECCVMCAIYWSQGKGNISISLPSTSISIRRHYQSVARYGCTQCIANDINPMSLANSHTYSLLRPVLLKPGREKTLSNWYINNDNEIYGFERFKGIFLKEGHPRTNYKMQTNCFGEKHRGNDICNNFCKPHCVQFVSLETIYY